MKILVTCLALSFTFQALALETKLATITTDTLNETTIFYVETNTDGSVQGLHYVTTNNESGQVVDDVYNTVAEVLDDGAVLKEMEGREVVRLYLENFSPASGGKVKLSYLENGVTGSRGTTYLKLVRTSGVFALTDTNGKIINTLFIKGKWSRLLRRWIGVSAITSDFESKNK